MNEKIAVNTNAALYSKGVFTTIAVYDGAPFLWEKHWRRLSENAAKVGIDLTSYSEEMVRSALDEAITTNKMASGRARITFFDDSPSEVWSSGSESKTTLSIIVGERRPVPEPFKLTTSPYPVNSRSPLAGVKSCNYLENILALDEAKGRGFCETVRVNERGHITSGAMSNVFWLKDQKLYTPALSTGCLAGTTREYVLENLECEEVEAAIVELERSDAIYLTSAGLGILAVAEFDGRRLADTAHAIARLLPFAAKNS